MPTDWSCEVDDGNSVAGAWIEVSSDVFDINISDYGRGPYCGDTPPLNSENCIKDNFYTSSNTSFEMYLYEGIRKEILGVFSEKTAIGFIWLSIKYEDMETRELTEDETQEIEMFIDSILFT